jgi:myo-inositol-1(or 4)-monophosphatase
LICRVAIAHYPVFLTTEDKFSVTQVDLTRAVEVATALAHEAGAVLRDFQTKPFQQIQKSNEYDIVTEADRAAEAIIIAGLQQDFPEHYLVGEESGGVGASQESAEYIWYIDPLDGTTNFANHIPAFSVSIALVNKQHEPLLGVVYTPVFEETFTAVRGQGAYLNGTRIQVNPKEVMSQCVIASGFPYTKTISADNNLAEWSMMLMRTRDLRRFGSAALDLCYVASGRFDGYWEQMINPWDYLAGAICVLEAGGVVTDYDGSSSPEIFRGRYIIAANPTIQAEMLKIIQQARTTLP